MKCPKCGYLGFEEVERCRHCGYDFPPAPRREPDVVFRRPLDRTPQVDDLDLIDAAAGARTTTDAESDLGAPLLGVRRSDVADDIDELPLFTEHTARTLTPRPPLSVRRAVPETPRARPERPPLVSLDFPSTDLDVSLDAPVSPAVRARSPEFADVETTGAQSASLGARYAAAVVDVALLALVDLVVVYLTVQICGLTINEVSALPLAPLAAFLALQNGGYLVACTVGGQTIGKWLMGIRVVGVDHTDIVDVGRSLLRTLVWVVLAVPAGLGLLTALLSDDRRGLHDRLSQTRVVRVAHP